MAVVNKLSKQELRQLMQEKLQSKKETRVDSPLARYDEQNNLWCIVCQQNIGSELHWTTHLIGKAHKKKVEELKQKKNQSSKQSNDNISNLAKLNLKRTTKIDEIKSPSNKVSKFSQAVEFSKKEIQIKESKNSNSFSVGPKKIVNESNDDDEEKKESSSQFSKLSKANNEHFSSTSLPQDFFDQGLNLEPMQVDAPAMPVSQTDPKSLPKGFFDDPFLDSKARKEIYKDPLEEQLELFRKEIAEEALVSETMIEEDIENLQKEKVLIEIDEQISNWAKVDHFQKKAEEIHLKRTARENSNDIKTRKKDQDSDDGDDDDEDELDLNDINFWRNKDVFR